jgi:hypothetical protein
MAGRYTVVARIQDPIEEEAIHGSRLYVSLQRLG